MRFLRTDPAARRAPTAPPNERARRRVQGAIGDRRQGAAGRAACAVRAGACFAAVGSKVSRRQGSQTRTKINPPRSTHNQVASAKKAPNSNSAQHKLPHPQALARMLVRAHQLHVRVKAFGQVSE